MNKIYKINVMIGNTERFFKGTIEKEDNDFIYIRGNKNNKVYTINKRYMISKSEVD